MEPATAARHPCTCLLLALGLILWAPSPLLAQDDDPFAGAFDDPAPAQAENPDASAGAQEDLDIYGEGVQKLDAADFEAAAEAAPPAGDSLADAAADTATDWAGVDSTENQDPGAWEGVEPSTDPAANATWERLRRLAREKQGLPPEPPADSTARAEPPAADSAGGAPADSSEVAPDTSQAEEPALKNPFGEPEQDEEAPMANPFRKAEEQEKNKAGADREAANNPHSDATTETKLENPFRKAEAPNKASTEAPPEAAAQSPDSARGAQPKAPAPKDAATRSPREDFPENPFRTETTSETPELDNPFAPAATDTAAPADSSAPQPIQPRRGGDKSDAEIPKFELNSVQVQDSLVRFVYWVPYSSHVDFFMWDTVEHQQWKDSQLRLSGEHGFTVNRSVLWPDRVYFFQFRYKGMTWAGSFENSNAPNAHLVRNYDAEGYDEEGYDRYGYDREGYDREGYDREGYNREGYDRQGYPKPRDWDGYFD